MAQTLSALPNGALVKDIGTTYYGEPIIWRKADTNHAGYPANSVTLITDRIISCKCFDAKEEGNANNSRASSGNGRYRTSNIRQWLNSNDPANMWWTAQNLTDGKLNTNNADAPPSSANSNGNCNGYDTENGFLQNFSIKMREALLDTQLTVVRNTSTDGGGTEPAGAVTDKIFLASVTEVGLANEGIAEGSLLPIFGDNTSRLAYPTSQAIAYNGYVTTAVNMDVNKPFQWILRTPVVSMPQAVRGITENGNFPMGSGGFSPYGSINGVRPLCNLPSDILVSDSPETDGVYRIIWSPPPEIDGSDSDLGEQTGAFTQGYTVTDSDVGDTITVTELLNGKQIRQYTATNGDPQTFTVSLENFLQLGSGTHTMKVVASDDMGETATRTWTFTRDATQTSQIQIRLATPLAADDMPERILLSINRQIPSGATFEVLVCNNAWDTTPAWEDATAAVSAGKIYYFTNDEKTDSDWGVNIQVNVNRNSAVGDCNVSYIGGNFD